MLRFLHKAKHIISVRKDFPSRMIILCILGGVVWWLYGYVGNKILRPIAVGQVKHLLGGNVEIDTVDFKGKSGAVRLNYLIVGPKQVDRYENRILRANKVDIRFSFFSVLTFRPKIKSVHIQDYIINAQYDSDSRQWNLGILNLKAGKGAGMLPTVKGMNGILKVTRMADGQVEDMLVSEIDWELRPVRLHKEKYAFYAIHHKGGKYGSLRGIWDRSEGRISLNGNVLMGKTPVFGNGWDMKNIQLLARYDDDGFSIGQLHWEMDRGSVNINGTSQWPKEGAKYTGRIQLNDLSIADEYAANKLVYSPTVLDVIGVGLRNFFTMYQPRGQGKVDVEFLGQLGSDFVWSGTVKCDDVMVSYRKFPYSLEHIQGILKVSQDSVQLDNLKCKHGKVDLNINGYSRGFGEEIEYDVQITSENMQLDDDLYMALNTKQKQLWFTFTPSGTAKIAQRIRKRPGEKEYANLTVELDGSSAVYQHFPYQLKNLTGKLVAEQGMIEFVNVVSAYDGKKITLNGRVTETESERPKYNIVISAKNIPIDSQLKMALPTRQRKFYENFTVNAVTDVEINVFPNEVGRRLVEYIANAEIRADSLVYKRFPYQLNNVYVRADLTPDIVILQEMTGIRGDGSVHISGKIWPDDSDADEPKVCLSLKADGIELDDELLDSLPANAQKIIRPLNVGGVVNVTADMNIGAEKVDCREYKIVIDCVDANMKFEKFAWPIKHITGRIELGNNDLLVSLKSVDTVGGRHGIVYFDSKVDLVNEHVAGGWFTIDANDVIIDNKFAEAFSGTGSDIFKRLEATGRMDLNVKNGQFFPQKDGGGRRFEIPIEAEFEDSSLGRNRLISDLNASVSMHISYETGSGLSQANAKVIGKSLKIKGRPLSNLRAFGRYEPADNKFVCKQFLSDCCGGKVTGQFSLDYPGSAGSNYMLQMVFDSLELERVVHAVETSPSEKLYSGSAGGDLAISGVLGDKNSRIGRINVGVSNMKVTKRSLAGKVLTAAKRNRPSDFIFSDMSVRSFIRRDELVFEQVLMSGSSTALRGSGKVYLDKNEIDLDFVAFGEQVKGEPSMLESLAKGLGGAMVKVEVHGNLNEPKITTTKLPVFQKPFQLFGEKKKK